MKKLLVFAAIAVFGFTTSQAQEWKIGVNGALPIGDFGDFYSFGLNADVMYLFEVADGVHVGPMAGVQHYFGKDFEGDFGDAEVEIKGEDATFIPIGATGRIMLGESFILGADLGYAIGIAPDGNDGGFNYRPRIGYMFTENVSGMLMYQGIVTDGDTLNAITLGVEIGL